MPTEITLLILGWALGLLSTIILDWYRDWSEREIVKPALLEELHELRQRLVHHAFLIERKHGSVNYDFIKWAQSALKQYKGTNIDSTESLIQSLSTLLNLRKEEVDAMALVMKERIATHRGTGLRKHSLPMLETNMGIVRRFDPILRGKILEVKTRVGFLNELIDESRYYFQLSFETGITPENYQIASQNMIETNMFYAARARDIVDLIGGVPEK